jgi:hypothetical protein
MDETGGGFYDQQQQQQQREVAESAAALEHVALHKEVVQNMRYQPWDMGRKLRVLRRAKSFVRQHEGALQQRLAESRTAKDVFARGRLLLAKVNVIIYNAPIVLPSSGGQPRGARVAPGPSWFKKCFSCSLLQVFKVQIVWDLVVYPHSKRCEVQKQA